MGRPMHLRSAVLHISLIFIERLTEEGWSASWKTSA